MDILLSDKVYFIEKNITRIKESLHNDKGVIHQEDTIDL